MHFQCPWCLRDFTRRAALRNHIKTHDSKIDRILQEIVQENRDELEIVQSDESQERGENSKD
jgi:uncharacterized Zn-finger protein